MVSMFAITPCPMESACVEAKPMNSSALSGMLLAPGMPPLIAICLGRLWLPLKPPPTKPLRMLVTVNKLPAWPGPVPKMALAPAVTLSSESLRSSTAT